MKPLTRALKFFYPDKPRIAVILILMIGSTGLNILKPWPMALIVDGVLGQKLFPNWLPATWTQWPQAEQLGVLILLLLVLHLTHAGGSAIQHYITIGVGLRGRQRVRN